MNNFTENLSVRVLYSMLHVRCLFNSLLMLHVPCHFNAPNLRLPVAWIGSPQLLLVQIVAVESSARENIRPLGRQSLGPVTDSACRTVSYNSACSWLTPNHLQHATFGSLTAMRPNTGPSLEQTNTACIVKTKLAFLAAAETKHWRLMKPVALLVLLVCLPSGGGSGTSFPMTTQSCLALYGKTNERKWFYFHTNGYQMDQKCDQHMGPWEHQIKTKQKTLQMSWKGSVVVPLSTVAVLHSYWWYNSSGRCWYVHFS